MEGPDKRLFDEITSQLDLVPWQCRWEEMDRLKTHTHTHTLPAQLARSSKQNLDVRCEEEAREALIFSIFIIVI